MTLFKLPEVLTSRKRGVPKVFERKNGKGIKLRPQEVLGRNTFSHWESDRVLGRKRKGEPVMFTIVEQLTGYYLSIRIDGKTVNGVASAIEQLHQQYGERFSKVFRTITSDNGSEFADFSSAERYGSEIYFAEPYSAWERPVNERTNRLLRRFIPKGKSIPDHSDQEILYAADEINAMPRKRLGYAAPEELFEEQLDQIYQVHSCSTLFC